MRAALLHIYASPFISVMLHVCFALFLAWRKSKLHLLLPGFQVFPSAFTGGDGVSGVAGPLRRQLCRDVKLPWSPCQSSEDLDNQFYNRLEEL